MRAFARFRFFSQAATSAAISGWLSTPRFRHWLFIMLISVSASIMASATPTPFAPRDSTSVLEARSLRGLRRDAEGSHVAETIGEAHALPPRFSHGRRDRRIHAVGCCHIGGVAHICMGASAHRLHRHVEYPTVADEVIDALFLPSKKACWTHKFRHLGVD